MTNVESLQKRLDVLNKQQKTHSESLLRHQIEVEAAKTALADAVRALKDMGFNNVDSAKKTVEELEEEINEHLDAAEKILSGDGVE